MNPFLAQLATEHLQDLLREADEARRWKLIRAAERRPARSLSLGQRITASVARFRAWLDVSGRPKPASCDPAV